MRKIVTGTALVLAAGLLTGCGSGGSKSEEAKGSTAPGKPAATASSSPSGSGKPASGGGEVSHEVTLEVLGSGPAQVYYNLASNKGEQVTLPWKKTETITFTTEAEKRIGTTVSVVPGSVQAADGMLKPASCVITVDGKKVADNQDGKTPMCNYRLK
ncbi:hypothetical protein [Streptomyces sp. KS 21]|uniref:hypothetical protein n=1 Tax=Streptomyces sp. KS 21 TaxID=2485150 RepID=UPI001063EB56|nr:hypothetical protein [Streptomyces sp. KS 21]TDU80305.1 hypothetical protein EDD91_7141 [Streptomyces sp. KS 21]